MSSYKQGIHCCNVSLTLCLLGYFHTLFSPEDCFSKKNFRNTIKVLNSLEPHKGQEVFKIVLLTVPSRYFYCGSFMGFFLFCVCYAFVCVCLLCLVVTCWIRADLLALVCGV